jgi:CTP:molybdopterin cytidylyltransferase MocA
LVAGLILAAGGSRRFGEPKQLASLAGRPLLEHVIRNAVTTPAVDRWIVVLGASAEQVTRGVDLHGVQPVSCEAWEKGQSESLRSGIDALREEEAAVILLGDQPLVTAAAIERVVGARCREALAARATYGGAPGHPVVVERPLFPRLARVVGDIGAREVLAAGSTREVPCDDVADPADVDAPGDLRQIEGRIDRPRSARP